MSEEEKTPEVTAHEEAVAKAKALGWVPKEEYKGDPEKWRDAEEFNEFGERLNPILRENNKRLEMQLKAKEEQHARELAEIRAAVAKFAKMHEETEKVAYAKALAELRSERKEALELGDFDRAEEVTERIETTKAAAKEVAVTVHTEPRKLPPEIPAEIQEVYAKWSTKNQWAVEGTEKYNPEMDAYARAIGEVLVKSGVSANGDSFEPFLNKVTEKVKARFPEEFGNPLRKMASVEGDGSGGDGTPTGKQTYANLPKEAKDACDFLIETGTFKSRAEYVARYYADKK